MQSISEIGYLFQVANTGSYFTKNGGNINVYKFRIVNGHWCHMFFLQQIKSPWSD